ncbi:kinase-like domain-containing protein [Massariosphaeria phaeospora]|uniref:non-specific serine/threonine protein kinase n=1 Tax=Massariosphaeria phaeospora TaxID=100035 RepID=A0A7C8MC92_9PLEO|nr:kinase-like domain-containing protein [Massariosphaeria phaeospora]
MPEDDKYDVLEKIGHGSFGIIRKVKRKSDGYILCRKEISYSRMSPKEREQLHAELSILKELRHPNIVAYFEREHLKMSQDLHLYMEYCGNGDLGRVIKRLDETKQLAEEDFVWSVFSQIVSALYRCHYGENPPATDRHVMGRAPDARPHGGSTQMILHRDLKPENIFLDADNSVKLGDFGLSKIIQSHDFASTYVGTPFYMSPEICKAEKYGPHSDIWALGCIIYELCTKQPPFNAKTHWDLIQKIKAGRYQKIPSCYSPELANVIASCLQIFPSSRPDTAQLLNLPIVKLMRKEQEVVSLAQELKREKDRAAHDRQQEQVRMDTQMDERLAEMRRELESQLRREWEVKARLEIDRRVQIEVEEKWQAQAETMQKRFSEAVDEAVAKALAKHPARPSTSPKLAPRSSTPTMPAEQGILFPSEADKADTSFGTSSGFASGTDMSSLSLSDPADDPEPVPTVAAKPVTKRPTRAPMSRARTMYAGTVQAPPSPMDVQMGEPSPGPASIAGLSLSPRRNARPSNIFAAAKENAKRWEPEIPASPEGWNGDPDDDDHLPALPSPTRARSASGSRRVTDDPFKTLMQAQRPLHKLGRLGNTPTLAPTSSKPRPMSVVPIVATSPSRQKSKSIESLSPVRKTTGAPRETGGLKSKKGNEAIRMQAMRNNGIQGRTLVELQQARGIPLQTMSEDEGKRGMRTGGPKSPVKTRSAYLAGDAPAVWDPDTEVEMPSPFKAATRRMVL